MKRSLNETGGMIHKAARGAGLPLGHADDLAAAGVRYVATGGAAAEITRDLRSPDGVWLRGPQLIDNVLVSDQPVTYAQCPSAQLMVAMAVQRGITASIDGQAVVLSPATAKPAPLAGPINVSEADWRDWSDLAARTYVPATEESRSAGAGAGLTDND